MARRTRKVGLADTDGAVYRPSVQVEQVEPNEWNYNRQSDFVFEREVRSLERYGMIDPILVRKHGDFYQIIDGEHRWRAACYLKHKTIPVYDLGEVGDDVAQQLTVVMNEVKGRPDYIMLGRLLQELEDDSKLDRSLVPFTELFLDRLMQQKIDLDDMSSYVDVVKELGEDKDEVVKRSYQLIRNEQQTVETAIELALGESTKNKRTMGQALVAIARWASRHYQLSD